MDPNNQNLDGIKPGDNPTPSSGVDGFVVPVKNSNGGHSSDFPDNQTVEEPINQPVNPQKPKSGRGLKILLVLFIVLFAASTALAVMLYLQNKQAKDDLKVAQNKAAQLQSQANSSSQQQVEQLTAENATLQKTINQQNAYIDSLTKVAQALKTKCGTACSSITIPPNTVTAAPTPTPTSTPTPTTSPTPTPIR